MADNSNDKLYSILAYISVLVLVPIIVAQDSQVCRFHANQGLVLLIAEIAGQILITLGSVLSILSLFGSLLMLVCFVFSILGIVSAAKLEMKPLPIIGDIHLIR
ncbi:hypothetical protein [Acetanaerobacterium elongatum]|uniref:Chloroplast import component protein (Tic20) n=1 Tax=Acetanaerobacterium elongatum TaxID=258515 RepID=A0A1G9XWD0_9FIRM|nr:hypothetical protein [Acetanaerobacterium elongatum]SDN01109.1 hypothetical protein SAMN05192585_10967 [Acetanaerobacterium elongatum]